MMPDIDICQFDTDGYRWQDFYRLLRPCDFNNDKLSLKIDGSGDITGFGDVQTLTVKINGSGDIMLKELKSKSTKIIINGSGDAKVWASKIMEKIK